jgi:predicted permease
MEEIVQVLVSVVLAMGQIVILVLVGVYMSRRKVLSESGIKTLSDFNYYVFLPIFSIIEISNAIDINKIQRYWTIFASFYANLILSYSIYRVIICFLNLDVRIRYSFMVRNSIIISIMFTQINSRCLHFLETYSLYPVSL